MKALVRDRYGSPDVGRFPLDEAPDALRYMDDGHARGKLVLTD